MLNNINCNKMGPLFCHTSGLIMTLSGILYYPETKYNEVFQNSLQKREERIQNTVNFNINRRNNLGNYEKNYENY